jgi:hypothetical protein
MAKLEKLEVERVDGVDEPATRQKFLIIKAEEPEELRHNVEQLLEKVEAALNALVKSEDLALSEEAAAALNEVARMLDLDFTFKAKKPKKEGEGEEYGYGYPAPKKPAKKAEDEIAKSIAAVLDEKLAPLAEIMKALQQSQQQTKPESRQAKAQDDIAKSTRKLGEGLFTNIVFGG